MSDKSGVDRLQAAWETRSRYPAGLIAGRRPAGETEYADKAAAGGDACLLIEIGRSRAIRAKIAELLKAGWGVKTCVEADSRQLGCSAGLRFVQLERGWSGETLVAETDAAPGAAESGEPETPEAPTDPRLGAWPKRLPQGMAERVARILDEGKGAAREGRTRSYDPERPHVDAYDPELTKEAEALNVPGTMLALKDACEIGAGAWGWEFEEENRGKTRPCPKDGEIYLRRHAVGGGFVVKPGDPLPRTYIAVKPLDPRVTENYLRALFMGKAFRAWWKLRAPRTALGEKMTADLLGRALVPVPTPEMAAMADKALALAGSDAADERRERETMVRRARAKGKKVDGVFDFVLDPSAAQMEIEALRNAALSKKFAHFLEQAERCAGAKAYDAAAVLYRSVLEALLIDWLMEIRGWGLADFEAWKKARHEKGRVSLEDIEDEVARHRPDAKLPSRDVRTLGNRIHVLMAEDPVTKKEAREAEKSLRHIIGLRFQKAARAAS